MSGRKRSKTKTLHTNDKRREKCARGKILTNIYLPPELWELIFKNVETPKDLLNCWNTSSAWATALRSTDFYFKMTLPFVLPYLRRNDLLACSAVSKFWNASVDLCIDAAHEESDDCSVTRQHRVVFGLVSSSIPDFLSAFKLSSDNEFGELAPVVNPVAFRFVTVWLLLNPHMLYGLPDIPERMDHPFAFDEKNLLKCLDHFGHHIRRLSLSITGCRDESISYNEQIKLIRNCLRRTPNLRMLEFSPVSKEHTTDELYGDEEGSDDEASDEEEPDASARVPKDIWPSLEHFKSYKLGKQTGNDLNQFGRVANAYASQLQYLQFGFAPSKFYRPFPKTFPCLQKVDYFYNNIYSGRDFERFMRESQCSLKHLTVVFQYDPSEVASSDFTRGVNAASDTLETLAFRRECFDRTGCKSEIMKFDQMHLPQLTELEVSGIGYPSLEFLQQVCPVIQQLSVNPSYPDNMSKNMRKSGAKMYSELYSQHLFWEKLPHIERVSVEVIPDPCSETIQGDNAEGIVRKVYTRQEYNATL